MQSLYSIGQNYFETEGQKWSFLTRHLKNSRFHNDVTYRSRELIFSTERRNILHCAAWGDVF